jgi:hypothetical protein
MWDTRLYCLQTFREAERSKSCQEGLAICIYTVPQYVLYTDYRNLPAALVKISTRNSSVMSERGGPRPGPTGVETVNFFKRSKILI